MSASASTFQRPMSAQATRPPERRGLGRDQVRLLVSRGSRVDHGRFHELAGFLRAGDLLVVNRSATLAASLPARAKFGDFRLNLSTDYGRGIWLAEPRWDRARPGPLPLAEGDSLEAAGLPGQVVSPYPGIPRLIFVALRGNVRVAMTERGSPISYAYLARDYPLADFQTIFATVPGSAEMPSAARPFTARVLRSLERRGIELADIVLHTGVSSLEREENGPLPIYPEPFWVPVASANSVNAARREGRRVLAVGTSVVRALETAAEGCGVRPMRGFTRAFIDPRRGRRVVDGLLTGLHDARTTHLALLEAFVDAGVLSRTYAEAAVRGYLWHEFGDSHLILPSADG